MIPCLLKNIYFWLTGGFKNLPIPPFLYLILDLEEQVATQNQNSLIKYKGSLREREC